MSQETKKGIYFKGLNGLRGIAAILVLFGHTGDLVFPNGIDYNPLWCFLSQNGNNAVSFFFVLSGFLISYLMLTELKDTGTIHVGRFYLKRVFRIWPIYYLIIILSQFVFPFILMQLGKDWKTVSNLSTFFYLIILPNVPYIFMDSGKLFHLWSIGVEEQFYLIWAPAVKWCKNNFLKLCISIIVGKFVLVGLLEHYKAFSEGINAAYLLLKQFRIEQMCVGGIGAYYLFKNNGKLPNNLLVKKGFQLLIFGLLTFFLVSNEKVLGDNFAGQTYEFLFDTCGYLLIPFLYLYLLLNVSLNEGSLLKLENRPLNFMGTISYGFYVYHVISIVTAGFVMGMLHLEAGNLQYALVFYAVAGSINTGIAWLSFHYFEKKILSWGHRKLNLKRQS